MNTRTKIAWLSHAEFAVFAVAAVVVCYLQYRGTVTAWALLVLIPLHVFAMPLTFVLSRRFNTRYEAAKLRGSTLCSRCEYEIPETQEKVACPECGVVRSAKEHREVLESWKWWKT